MEGIERAIRNAFAKGDAGNPATRQRIYESAWSAHEHALSANAALSEQQKTQRRDRLKATISRIETEFRPAQPSAGAAQRARVEPDLGPGLDPDLDDVSAGPRSGGRKAVAPAAGAPTVEGPALDRDDVRPVGKKPRRADLGYEGGAARRDGSEARPRSPFLSYVLPALVLLGVAFVGWSLFNSFTDVRRSPGALSNGAPAKEGEEARDANWITIFTPSDPTRMSVRGRATAEIASEGSVSFVRVKSSGPDDEVVFDVGQGVLEEIAGRKATFDIIARSDDGKPTQMSVSCDFGTLGDCGRKRYDVINANSDFLFDVEFPEGKQPDAAGTITINSDISGAGKIVDIHAIRVSIAP
ncbi:hypothetical protein C5748_23815 [Phyllobacterium phragmitis]|uniref:Biotin transporter BioY n=1 Tax=Phyllobacterium phragmitis TaxID=2670329 RepID=A0A2S9IKF2_9HYPH|nr:hypothetical protein [Phyllobacterium phragmitis]PRD41011.1 hypothetical protein C5748_23815 [Phyllobacterium phragmitis]